MYLKKVMLVKLPNGGLCIIPIESFKNGMLDWENRERDCRIIKSGVSLHFWIYEKFCGYDVVGNEDHIARPITPSEVEEIISIQKGQCLIMVESNGAVQSPSNTRGDRSILLVKDYPQIVYATRNMSEGFVHTETSETCPFCEKEKIASGIYLHFNKTGHPCCNNCYKKEGFNEWYYRCNNLRSDTPKQLSWFVDMYYRRGITPEEAIEEMLLVV